MNRTTILRNASSTDCISSDNGTGAEALASGSFAQSEFPLDEADNLSREEDDESLLVQESIASSSTSPQRGLNVSPITARDKKAHVFQRLSKSASRLLSQNKQTLSEMLNVEGESEVDPNMQVNLELGVNGRVEDMKATPESEDNKETSPLGSVQSKQHLELESHYLNKIHELEQKLKNKEKELELEKKLRKKDASQRKNGSNFASNEERQCSIQSGISYPLSSDQISRYSRQLLLSDGFGVEGQRKLLNSSVLGKFFPSLPEFLGD